MARCNKDCDGSATVDDDRGYHGVSHDNDAVWGPCDCIHSWRLYCKAVLNKFHRCNLHRWYVPTEKPGTVLGGTPTPNGDCQWCSMLWEKAPRKWSWKTKCQNYNYLRTWLRG